MRTGAKALGAVLVAALVMAVAATPSFGAYVHTIVTGEYGKGGSKSTGLGEGCSIAYQSANHRLYIYSDEKIYGLDRTAQGSVSPLAGFPVPVGLTSRCGDRDMTVDNTNGSSKNNIYLTPSNTTIYGYNAAGAALAPPWPVDAGGETCGVAVTNTGEVWGGNYGSSSVSKFSAAGVAAGAKALGYNACKLAIDPTNNDLFVVKYSGGDLTKYTAASGYETEIPFGSAGYGNAGLAVNGAQHRLYTASGSTVMALDTETGAVVETISVAPNTADDVAVDEATDTIFVSLNEGASGFIQERPGIVVPDVTTGEPTGFATLHGHVDPAGGGEVTSCKFEFSTSAEYTIPTTQTAPCSPSIPPNYSGPQDVTADLTGLVTGETLYHFRLVASNANGTIKSADRTFTPHFVAGLHTDPATEIDRKSAKLNGSFLGTNEDTHYYFKWGMSAGYGNTTPVEDAGTTNSQTAVSAVLNNVLEPGTTYHYKLVATNAQGTSEANDATVTTKPAVFDVTTEAATEVKTSTADLNGSFTGDGLDTKYYFEWGTSTLYGEKTTVGEIQAPSGATTIPSAGIEGLQPLHTYHFRLVAENSFGTTRGADETLTTFSPPVISAQSSSHVTGTSADLHAVINTHGSDVEYHFEYGHTPDYGSSVPIPDAILPDGPGSQPVDIHLTGLNGDVYHFRVVARNVYGETKSQDQTFNFYPPVCPNSSVRQQTGSNTLPDCRAYELVSSEDAGNTIIYPATVPFSPTATSPSRLVYAGAFGLISGTGPAANNIGDTYVATRTNTGWKSKYVGVPAQEAAYAGGPPWTYDWAGNYQSEPDKWLIDVLTNQSLSKLVDWNDGYYPCNEKEGCQGYGNGEGVGSSNAPYVWDTGTGKQVDRWPTNVGAIPGGEFFKGRTAASADLSHFVFTSDIPFAVGGEPGDMYDNDTQNATVEIISRDSSNEPISAVPVELSDDGSHVLMTEGGGRQSGGFYTRTTGPGKLYMRVGDSITYDIAPGHAVNYIGMTPDGKKVYFTSTEDLTSDGSDTDTSRDIYMWSEESASPNQLTLISKGNDPSTGNTDECNAPWTNKCDVVPISFVSYTSAQASIGGGPYTDSFIAADSGDIYYLSPEMLHGANGVNGAENLYVYRNGKNQFVAALDPNGVACTSSLGLGGTGCSETAVARIEVTPDDSFMAFLTGSKVAGYDNAGHSEMYLYRPATEEMTCVSCLPSGQPPTADVTTSHNGLYLTNDGRTFFETKDALVPQDTNEARDVYEYVEGRPQLVSSGTAASNDTFGVATIGATPGLVGVSANGLDVFFATYDTLVGQDRNGEALKIYDARSGGGFQFVPPPPPCVAADECHGASSSTPPPPVNGTGASLGGNVAARPTQRKGKRVKRHNKKKAKHHRKAHRKGHRNG